MEDSKIIDIYDLGEAAGEVGIEIEIEGSGFIGLGPAVGNWRRTNDGSLRGNDSAELVLKRPVALHKVPKVLQDVVDWMEETDIKWEPSERTGVHIHINVQQMTERQVFTFASLYLMLEDVLTAYCGPSRTGNLFCLTSGDAERTIEVLIKCARRGSFTPALRDNFRYAALNFLALMKYGSLEFRAMETPPLDELVERLFNWARMLHAVRSTSLRAKSPRELIEQVSKAEGAAFLRGIMPLDLFNLLNTPQAEQQLMAGVRRVQDVAYIGWHDREDNREPVLVEDIDAVRWQPQEIQPRPGLQFRPLPPQMQVEIGNEGEGG